jgi:hypothetical protein
MLRGGVNLIDQQQLDQQPVIVQLINEFLAFFASFPDGRCQWRVTFSPVSDFNTMLMTITNTSIMQISIQSTTGHRIEYRRIFGSKPNCLTINTTAACNGGTVGAPCACDTGTPGNAHVLAL